MSVESPSFSFDVLQELEQVDVLKDLDDKSLKISANGAVWDAAPTPENFEPAQLLNLYYQMALTRAVDDEIVKLSRKGMAFGKHLRGTGNEAVAVGAAAAVRPDDWLTLAIRDLGAYIVRDIPIHRLLAQACGRVDGLTQGWDGSLHMGSLSSRIIGLVSHLGTLIPVGTGCAFAERYKGSDAIVLSFSGDGATSTGDFHEGLNIASVLHLPMVIVIENNQWAFGTPTRLQYAIPTLSLRAIAYGRHVEGHWIDGTNVLTVFDRVSRAVERCRQDGVISLIEAVSMRYEGHSLADPFQSYVPSDQLTAWKAKDPIASFRNRLVNADIASDEDFRAIDARIAAEVRAAAIKAESSAPSSDLDLAARVFVSSRVEAHELAEPPASGVCTTYHQAIHDALAEEMERDPNLFLIGEDIGISNGAFKITEGFSKDFDGLDWNDVWNTRAPFVQRRVVDAPIAEAGFTGLALGAVQAGLRAVVEFQYADFASEAFKMIVNYAATETVRGMGPLPIVFRLPSGWAPNTSIYHSVNPESWFGSTPGLKIVAPITAFDAKGLLKAAIRDDNPVLFLEYKTVYRVKPERLPPELNLPIPEGDYIVPFGNARVVRKGTDISLITYGSQVHRALEAANRVAREDGLSIEVIDLRTLVPLDSDSMARSVRKTARALVTCEAPRTGCYGHSIVSEIIRTSFDDLDAPVRLVAAADTPVPFAPALETAHLPVVGKLVDALRDLAAY